MNKTATTKMTQVPIERLIPYINNARTHSPEQIKKLRASLRNRFRTLRYQSQALRLHCRRSNRRFTNLLEKLCTGHKQMPNERLGFTTADEELSHRLRLRVNHWTHSVFISEMRRKICPILPPDFLT